MKTNLFKTEKTRLVFLLFFWAMPYVLLADGNPPVGAINGYFSVSENSLVHFSQGNLQYQASTNTWKFAEHQYDYVGDANSNISSTYSGWIDLFGWGTSGYHDSNDPYNVNYQPWSTASSTVNTNYNAYGYGPSTNVSSPNLTGGSANYDWGVYNSISNGGNQPNLWRTLTNEEWSYVFKTRNTSSGIRYAKAQVNNVNGIILLPDDWSTTTYNLNNANSTDANYTSNIMTASQWEVLEQVGAVFLPAAGMRSETSLYHVGTLGGYWSTSFEDEYYAYEIDFAPYTYIGHLIVRLAGYSVRLVCDVVEMPSWTFSISVSASPNEGGSVLGGGSYTYGQSCTVHATVNEGYTFFNWTENGSEVSTDPTFTFTVNSDRNLVANFTTAPQGAIDGLFSIGNNRQVYFSKGNLQYQASTNIWKFAEHQYDRVGSTNNNISSTYNGWIDLFGWGTSGYNHGANCYQPWSTSETYEDYYAYGQGNYNLNDQSGEADWGCNPISNGGNQGNQWRTLTREEWVYLFNTRSTASGIRYAKATVNNVWGVILLPDDWSINIYSLNNTNSIYASFTSNTLTASQWNILEQAGAVFLPAAGRRNGTTINVVSDYGYYWSASSNGNNLAYCVNFYSSGLNYQNGFGRYVGFSVRLACDKKLSVYTINALPNSTEGGTVLGSGEYEEGSTCTLTATPNEDYVFVSWTENDLVVSTNANYSFIVDGDRSFVANFVLLSSGYQGYVDLGLPSGLLWATCNIGANSPEIFGDYYAWGETQSKNAYSWSNYQLCQGNGYSITKYCYDASYGNNGFTDNLMSLLTEDDAATANWGSDWRMPSRAEWQELYDNTTSAWTTLNGVNGRVFVSTNGNTLFLPAAGDYYGSEIISVGHGGYYYSKSLFTGHPDEAYTFCVYSDELGIYISERFCGGSVRPVRSIAQSDISISGYGNSTGGYYLIAPPFNNIDPDGITGMTEGDFDLFYFDQGQELEWRNYKKGAFNLASGKGYLYAHGTDVTLNFTGVPYNDNGQVHLDYVNGAEFAGWNLVGNPFLQTAYLIDSRPFFVMNTEGTEIIAAGNSAISPMQGIFVVTDNVSGEDITFTTSAPSNSKGQIMLNLKKDMPDEIDRAIVRFDGRSTLPKFMLDDDNTKVYIPQGDKQFAVVNSSSENVIPVNFKSKEDGVFALEVNIDNLEMDYLHLIDNITGIDVDLLATPKYTFEAHKTDYASRFKLVLDASNSVDNTFAYISNGNVVVTNKGESVLRVIDVLGRLISTQIIHDNANISVMNIPGVYVLQLVNGTNVKTQKIVVE